MIGSEQSLFIGEQGKEKSQCFLGVAAAEGPTCDVAAGHERVWMIGPKHPLLIR